ncbi:hypothetical protein ONS95_005354 [Cadophora gregata]|uniref:uncharacterized protein n=1 Tax=Cadophora gregata TaxID=51156 RepID=UPI0026DB3332|nr:uncharacterized protein ONS95_005354 [Cadophora gregata]KAK0103325.1 hypothetical protein ONS95_005354 [Cadophora gregata]KAK0107517.1 hypothetical protein ONS96_003325 [Cadophora gregata f. sp. sojae]
MQFFTTTGLLAMLTLGSVVTALPPATTSIGLDMNVTFDEYIKQFKQPEPAESLEKRWGSTTCGGLGLPLLQIAFQAVELCNSAIISLEFQDDTNRRRFDRYFGPWNNNPNGRAIIRDRYRMIVDTLWNTNFNLICLPNQTNGNVVADVSFTSQGNPANVRLFQAWFRLSDDNQCGEQLTKANVLVHEASHVFGAADHGNDQGNDAYLIGWYASSVYSNCPF